MKLNISILMDTNNKPLIIVQLHDVLKVFSTMNDAFDYCYQTVVNQSKESVVEYYACFNEAIEFISIEECSEE